MSTNYNGTNNGYGQASSGTSLSAFLASLVTNVIVWAVEVGLFIVLRTLFKRIYEPRSFLETIPEDKRVEALPPTPWGWIPKLLLTRTHVVIGKSGLDGYFLLRYLRMMIILFGASLLVVWPVLLPINAVNQRGAADGVQGLDLLSISNVSSPNRYWAHVLVAIAFIAFTCYMMFHELAAFIRIRQDNLTSDVHKGTVRATTILVTSIPENFLSVRTLRQVFSVFPGGVKNVFLNRDCSDLLDMVQERDSIAQKLEGAETELIVMANKLHRKELAKRTKEAKKRQKKEGVEGDGETEEVVAGSIVLGENESLVDRYVPQKKRPTNRLPLAKWMPSLPLIGKKVDTVLWAREELMKMNPTIARLQARPERYEAMNSAFIQFNTQLAAHMACQAVASHKSMFMTPRYIETAPDDVVWDNMQLVWWQRVIRVYLINAAIATLIVFYAIPTAFVGSISNITYLTNMLPWLRWIYNLPPQLLGLLTGLLPAIMLSIWLAILPFILRIACKYQGWPTRSVIELKVQDLYFAFMVIQVFLVVSIASSSTAVVTQIIQNPNNIPSLLAQNLPKSSNFFFSYLLLQGLSVSAGTLLQIVTLLLFYLLGKLFDKTPRSLWSRFNTLPGLGWGTTYPIYTNLAVIGLSYAIISPLIMLFVVITFCLFYFTYLYNFLFVNGFVTDTGGLAFPKAIYQTFTGIYFAEICLLGIFFITSGARAQGIVMVVVLVLTVLYHFKLQEMFDPLITYLPIDIQEELLSQVQAQKIEDGRNPDEEAAQFEGPAPNDVPPQEGKPSTSLQAIPVQPRVGKFEHGSVQSSKGPIPEDDEQLGELEQIPSSPTGKRGIHWINPASQIRDQAVQLRDQIRNVGDKLPISIPGLTRKKVAEDDEDDANIDTTLMRKFTHELTEEELTAMAFEHAALRSRPPILWIPEDELGIAKDEIRRTKVECGKEVAITCRGAKLTDKGKIVYEGNPPDYFYIPNF